MVRICQILGEEEGETERKSGGMESFTQMQLDNN